jgi:TRAP-type C4-dicarboxylate transport system substrate-binding protein
MKHLLAKVCTAATLAFAFGLNAAGAEPTKLKLAFYTSDRGNVFEGAVKPFVDAINAEGRGLLEIEVHYSGTLGKSPLQQPQLVLDGAADIAFIIPGMTPALFPDNAAIEMPGLFRSMREATLTYTRLVAANRLRGYDAFHVIGAYGTDPESIHSRPPISSLSELKGKRIRANNSTEAAAIERLGGQPVVMAINAVPEAITRSDLDGAAAPPSMLFEFGIGRVATYHYFLRISSAPLALVMNRTSFERLPEPARDLIRKYSGEWTAARFIESRETVENQVMKQLEADSRRKLSFPTELDRDRAHSAFAGVIEDAVARRSELRELLAAARSETQRIRSSQ